MKEEEQFRRAKTLYQKTKFFKSLRDSSHTAQRAAESISENSSRLFYTQRKTTQTAFGLHIGKKQKLQKSYSACNRNAPNAFQFSSKQPSLGTPFPWHDSVEQQDLAFRFQVQGIYRRSQTSCEETTRGSGTGRTKAWLAIVTQLLPRRRGS